MLLASIYLVLLYEYNADRAAFNARHLQAKENLRQIIGQVIFAFAVVIGLYGEWGLPGVLAAQIVGILSVRILAWFYWKGDSWRLTWSIHVPKFRDIFERTTGTMGRGYIIYGILFLCLQTDALLLGWLTDPEVVAKYYLLWRIPEVIILLLWRIPGSYGPFLIAMDARGEHQALRKNYNYGLNFIVVMAALAAIAYGAFGPWMVATWVGENAPDGDWPYFLTAGAMFFLAVSRWPSGFAYSLVNTTTLNRITALELIGKVILTITLIKQFEYISPIFATFITHITLVFYLYLWLGKSTISSRTSSDGCQL